MRRDRVVALVVAESERQVGVHGVEPAILERVGAHLVDEADPAALLAQVQHEAALACAPICLERHLELIAAVAAQRAEGVPGEALGVQPRRHVARRR